MLRLSFTDVSISKSRLDSSGTDQFEAWSTAISWPLWKT